MGYADIGAYGNTYHRTPTIDRLAAEGIRFTNAYAAAPNCSPTRASILTGRWPARTGITQYLPGNVLPYARMLQAELPVGLPLVEAILAEPLAKAGYSTACVGKWHLGGGDYSPDQRGFGESFASGHLGPSTMFAPYRITVPGATDGDYLTDVLTDAAERFIERNRDTPFFLYMSYYSVHSPIQAKPELIDAYAGRNDPSGRENAVYAAMVEGVDRSVQRLMAKLEHLGLEENTAVFFFSDNGGVPRRAFNGGFRSGKGYLWEGGIREPLIVRWPESILPGSVEETPVSSVDFYPTILEMAGAADVPGHTIDGVSLVPLLEGSGTIDRPALFWHYPHYSQCRIDPDGRDSKGPLEASRVLRGLARRVLQPRDGSCRDDGLGENRFSTGSVDARGIGRLERFRRRLAAGPEPGIRSGQGETETPVTVQGRVGSNRPLAPSSLRRAVRVLR